jgi:hypothetical protein
MTHNLSPDLKQGEIAELTMEASDDGISTMDLESS